MKIIKGGVTAPKGFLAAAVSCGIKKSGCNDLALLYSEKPCLTAGMFTTNKVRSGSVFLCERLLKKNVAQAVIVNSGNANCCVGKKEIIDAEAITVLTAKNTGLAKNMVLIASTGIIGKPLPVAKIKNKIGNLASCLKKKNSLKFAKSIMTTDTVPKEISVSVKINGKTITIGGAVKGAGMICPNMATMLAFFTTDAAIEKSALKQAFKESVSDSFNRITVDGDMSTNDSAFIFANGMAGNKAIKKDSAGYVKFLDALRFVLKQLAKKMILDGEGATKFVNILVRGAKTQKDADRIARHVADSSLVKTMLAGGDPNWGRVVGSVGSSGVDVKQNKINIYFGNKLAVKNGAGTNVSRKALAPIFKKKEIDIIIDVNLGKSSGNIWTCDLTKEYVEINAEYET